MLTLELFAPLFDGVQAAHVHSAFKDAAYTNAINKLFVPSGKLVGLDEE